MQSPALFSRDWNWDHLIERCKWRAVGKSDGSLLALLLAESPLRKAVKKSDPPRQLSQYVLLEQVHL
jgi:hypothetical protein